MRVLIVADEIRKALTMKKNLEENAYEVDFALNISEALRLSIINTYGLIIADVVMPVLNGVELCAALRQQGVRAPVLMLTTFGANNGKFDVFKTGADEYLPKPVEFKMLLARVNTLTRSSK
jgi:two-component system, OmpR family, copper resistance phosphate regulon response regulator CusR